MSQPPPTTPPTLNYAPPPPRPRADLRNIAIRQRRVIFCILAYFIAMIMQFVLPPDLITSGLSMIAVMIMAAVFVFMLALDVYGTGEGIIMGILALIPLVGLIVLLLINNRATRLLRQHGIRVGLFGADTRQIPDRGQVPSGLR
jgi:hypothetical protein